MTERASPEVVRAPDPHGNLAHYVWAGQHPSYMGWNVAVCGVEVPDQADRSDRPLCPLCSRRVTETRARRAPGQSGE